VPPQLQELCLAGSNIDDRGLMTLGLRAAGRLQKIDLTGARDVTCE
jgi:hypothetical protein